MATATENQGNSSEFSEAIFEEIVLDPEDFVVVNTNDSGGGSLRQVIENVNSSSEAKTITFDIPGAGPHFIQPLSTYNSFTNTVVVDGTSQPGFSDGAPVIVLDGSLGCDISALVFTGTADNSTLKGLSIINFENYGIRLVSDSNTIEGNLIGLEPSGTVAGNNIGISTVNTTGNQIGGTSISQRNVISGNTIGIDFEPGSGIVLTNGINSSGTLVNSTANTIQGNYIGTDATGSVPLPKERAGILLLFGSNENTI